MTICSVNADAAPIQTASGRWNRADSTIVAIIVLSGSSARNTVANAAKTVGVCTVEQSTWSGCRPHPRCDRPSVTSPPVATAAHVWAIEQVVALAGSSARFGAGEAVAVPARWSRTGASERALWGRYHGSGTEPYDVAVDHVGVG